MLCARAALFKGSDATLSSWQVEMRDHKHSIRSMDEQYIRAKLVRGWLVWGARLAVLLGPTGNIRMEQEPKAEPPDLRVHLGRTLLWIGTARFVPFLPAGSASISRRVGPAEAGGAQQGAQRGRAAAAAA